LPEPTKNRGASNRNFRATARPEGIDVLAFGTHPDDLEITCGGTLLVLRKKGWRVGAVDLTRGELGTRGSAETRARETAAANKILKLEFRHNLEIPDGKVELNQANLHKVVREIREHRPWLVLAPYWEERHYDHVHASRLISEAAFYAGLSKLDTGQAAWRPFRVLYYVGRIEMRPSFIVDISATFADKMRALRCYSTQVHAGPTPGALPKQQQIASTMISTPYAMQVFETITRYYGAMIGAEHGEPFAVREALELSDPVEYFRKFSINRQAHLFPPI